MRWNGECSDLLSNPHRIVCADMSIRKLIEDDRRQVENILISTGVFHDQEIKIALELIDICLNDPNQRDYDIYSYVDDGNRVFGYFCIGLRPLTDGTYDLYWIAVSPEAQGKGIGKRLIAHAEELVKSKGGRLILAETSSRPAYFNTRKFYVHSGYSEIARIRDFYKIGDDLVVYGKYLTRT